MSSDSNLQADLNVIQLSLHDTLVLVQ